MSTPQNGLNGQTHQHCICFNCGVLFIPPIDPNTPQDYCPDCDPYLLGTPRESKEAPIMWEKIKETKKLIMQYVALDDQAEFVAELTTIVQQQAKLDDLLDDLSLHVWSYPANPDGEPNG